MKSEQDSRTRTLSAIAVRVAIVAGILGTILSVLMIVNYLQTQRADPLNSKAVQQLMQQLHEKPDDLALKEQIRALDLLARRAYFTNHWQVRTGSILLFVSVVVFLAAIKYLRSLEPQLPELTGETAPANTWQENILAKRYLTFTGISLFAIALMTGILTDNELRSFAVERPDMVTSGDDIPSLEQLRKNWPGFRGPEGIGVAHQTDIPSGWDGATEENIRWKTEIPLPGFSSPVVWQDRLFLSGADDRNQVVYCIDTETGSTLWQASLDDIPGSPAKRPKVADDTGLAASTMATDGKLVHVIFATGDVATLDFAGNRLWAKNIGLPDNHYGHSSSLIRYRNLLIVQFDHNKSQHLIALNAATGEQVYDILRGTGISWASPILVNTGQRDEVILNASPQVVSYDPASGQELWRVDCMEGEVAPSPAYADGMVFVATEYARLAAIEISAQPAMVWEATGDLPEVSSPVATRDLVFMASSSGAVSCLDAKTGERYWVHDFDLGFYSSPILVDDLIFLTDINGVTYRFKAEKSFELVSQSELGENVMTTPALMPGRIYIRGKNNLYCIGND